MWGNHAHARLTKETPMPRDGFILATMVAFCIAFHLAMYLV